MGIEDKRADVMMAAWNAAEAALRLVQVGNTNTQVTEAFGKIADEFKCKPVQGVLSHQLKKWVIDGNRSIMCAETAEEKVDEFEFEMNEVYCVDVVMSTGEGKTKETELRNTVYKRAVETSYNLKTQKARQFISEVNRRFPALPFTLRAIEDEEVAPQFKFTVLLLPGGTKRITGLPFGSLETQAITVHKVLDEDLKKLLSTSANPKKVKKKKAKEEKKD